MRLIHVLIFTFPGILLARSAGPQEATVPTSDLTVLMDFKGPWSRNVVAEMEREVASILKPSGLRPNWDFAGKHPQAVYTKVAVLTFRGSCEFDSGSLKTQNRGPYAFTWITDYEVMPFGEVNCDRVVSAVEGAMSGHGGYSAADQLIGRALGRVVAHELVHMVSRSVKHSTKGVEKPALTGQELIQPELHLTAAADGDSGKVALAGEENRHHSANKFDTTSPEISSRGSWDGAPILPVSGSLSRASH